MVSDSFIIMVCLSYNKWWIDNAIVLLIVVWVQNYQTVILF